MPRHAEPEEPMIFDATEKVLVIPYPSHYELQWKVPLDNGKEIDHFQIVYYQVRHQQGLSQAPSPLLDVCVFDPMSAGVLISSLPGYLMFLYSIRLQQRF